MHEPVTSSWLQQRLHGSPTTDVGDGVMNSGGGGGGGVHSSPNANQTHGGAGGSGLVIIAYPT